MNNLSGNHCKQSNLTCINISYSWNQYEINQNVFFLLLLFFLNHDHQWLRFKSRLSMYLKWLGFNVVQEIRNGRFIKGVDDVALNEIITLTFRRVSFLVILPKLHNDMPTKRLYSICELFDKSFEAEIDCDVKHTIMLQISYRTRSYANDTVCLDIHLCGFSIFRPISSYHILYIL